MEPRDLPHHGFYQPVAPGEKVAVAAPEPDPSLPLAAHERQHTTTSDTRYQATRDELKRILVGVVTQLINPKWWLYGLLEELGASRAFLKKFKGMSDTQIRTALLRSQLTRPMRFQILKRDNYTCHYCHRTGVPLEVDHVVPLYRGGTNDASNLVAACHDCNHSKGIQDA